MNIAKPNNPKKLEVSKSIVAAWRETGDALSVLFAPATVAFLILLALWIVRGRIRPSTGGLETLSYDVVHSIVLTFLMTPYAIAVHRFIILGEKTMSYRITPSGLQFRSFFGWSLALSLLNYAPAAVSAMLPRLGEPLLNDLLGFLPTVLSILVAVLAIRVIVLFPAVAVDARGANWREAIADTSGHGWAIFGITLIAMLPLFIVSVILGIVNRILDVVAPNMAPSIPALNNTSLWVGIVMLLTYTLLVVIASRLYQWIGFRVQGLGEPTAHFRR